MQHAKSERKKLEHEAELERERLEARIKELERTSDDLSQDLK